jgi:hypothetical protein
MLFLVTRILLGLQMRGGLQRIQQGYKSHPCELPPIRNVGYINEIPESKHHAYTTNNTLTYGHRLKHSKETRKPGEQYKQCCLLKVEVDYQRNLRCRLTSAMVQAVEEAPTGWHLLQTLPSLYLTISKDKILMRTNLLLNAGS